MNSMIKNKLGISFGNALLATLALLALAGCSGGGAGTQQNQVTSK